MFTLQNQTIDIPMIKAAYTKPTYGALVSFEGLVRADQKNGQDVKALLYIADSTLCHQQGFKIIEETLSQFPIEQAVCVQRIGQVNVGEAAIWIGVWATHRAHSFNACQYMIENVKKRLVIWKKEILTDGSTKWIYGEQTPQMV